MVNGIKWRSTYPSLTSMTKTIQHHKKCLRFEGKNTFEACDRHEDPKTPEILRLDMESFAPSLLTRVKKVTLCSGIDTQCGILWLFSVAGFASRSQSRCGCDD